MMARKLTEEGRYTAIRFSIEASRPLSTNIVAAITTALDSLRGTAKVTLPEPLRPPDDLFTNIPDPANGVFLCFQRMGATLASPPGDFHR
jgi:hypothetical protein